MNLIALAFSATSVAWGASADSAVICDAVDSLPAELALCRRDAGDDVGAFAAWNRAVSAPGVDGFDWNQRGWSALALGRRREAQESFSRAKDRSSTTQTQTESGLGSALTALAEGNPDSALEPLRQASLTGAHAIAAAAQLAGEALAAAGKPREAATQFRLAVEADAMNLDAASRLAEALDRAGDRRAAWTAAVGVLRLDPRDPAAMKIAARDGASISGDLREAANARRLARPSLDAEGDSPLPSSAVGTVRLGLFGAEDGFPASLTACSLVFNSSYVVSRDSDSVRNEGRAFEQWDLAWREADRSVDVRDTRRNIIYSSSMPFTVSGDSPRRSVLIRSARPNVSIGVDEGDREVRGNLTVVPSPGGFRLVNTLPIEQYLVGVVSMALPASAPAEAYRAQSVVSRTAVIRARQAARHDSFFDVLDDRSLQPTIGVSGELSAAAEAVSATAGVGLSQGGLPAAVLQQDDSGGKIELGSDDSTVALPPLRGRRDLERFLHEAPASLLSEAAPPAVTASTTRWMRIIDVEDIQRRLDHLRPVGTLQALLVGERTASGRVRMMRAVGSRGSAEFRDFREFQELLSPHSLRSSFFSLQPIRGRHGRRRLVVWGAGTGAGFGFSRVGAIGAALKGETWRMILSRYFPGDDIQSMSAPSGPSSRDE